MAAITEMSPGDKAQVLGFDKDEQSNMRRLLTLGLTPGTLFTLIRRAPLGDPLEICFRGFSLSIRKHDAKFIKIKKV